MPTVTVDRALWYHVSEFGIDFGAIVDFYDELSLTGKPLLEDCRIHISALAYLWRVPRSQGGGRILRRFWTLDGIHLLVPEDSHLIDVQAPPADILLPVGHSARTGDYSLVVHHLELGLMHYALSTKSYPAMTEEEARLRTELAKCEAEIRERIGGAAGMMANGVGVALQAAVGLIGVTAVGQLGSAFLEGLGFGTVDQIEDAKAQKKKYL